MSNIDYRYHVEEVSAEQMLTYLFASKGQYEMKNVLKVVQYTYVQHFDHKPVFNLGFGDLDFETGRINDEAMTGNGDVYRVFNTVLSTIPQFYNWYPDCIILVQGSDGRQVFEATCRVTCNRNCGESCHNYNRRMKTYCSYLTRKYAELEPAYKFLGGMRNVDNWFDFEDFIPDMLYDAIMVFQKNA